MHLEPHQRMQMTLPIPRPTPSLSGTAPDAYHYLPCTRSLPLIHGTDPNLACHPRHLTNHHRSRTSSLPKPFLRWRLLARHRSRPKSAPRARLRLSDTTVVELRPPPPLLRQRMEAGARRPARRWQMHVDSSARPKMTCATRHPPLSVSQVCTATRRKTDLATTSLVWPPPRLLPAPTIRRASRDFLPLPRDSTASCRTVS